MNIAVCIKQVPAVSQIVLEKGTNRMLRDGVPSIVNLCDKNAVEEALQLREKNGGRVVIFSMGPSQAEVAVRECIGMGADQGFLICDDAFKGSDTMVTSRVLAKAMAQNGDFDVILCGKQAMDGDTGQVGPGIAERLGFGQVTFVNQLKIENNTLLAERENRDGTEIVEAKLPVVCTVTNNASEPRRPSIKGKMAAKNAEIVILKATDLGFDREEVGLLGSATWVEDT
ncbi:MAG: electron transfer flavoprotein subunit beta/FixA family protein, partial [Eubacterium sp.]